MKPIIFTTKLFVIGNKMVVPNKSQSSTSRLNVAIHLILELPTKQRSLVTWGCPIRTQSCVQINSPGNSNN